MKIRQSFVSNSSSSSFIVLMDKFPKTMEEYKQYINWPLFINRVSELEKSIVTLDRDSPTFEEDILNNLKNNKKYINSYYSNPLVINDDNKINMHVVQKIIDTIMDNKQYSKPKINIYELDTDNKIDRFILRLLNESGSTIQIQI